MTQGQPLLTIRRQSGIGRATIRQLREAGYCVVLVREHADVLIASRPTDQSLDPQAQEILDVALDAIRITKSYEKVEEIFFAKLARRALDRLRPPTPPQIRSAVSA